MHRSLVRWIPPRAYEIIETTFGWFFRFCSVLVCRFKRQTYSQPDRLKRQNKNEQANAIMPTAIG